MSTATPETTRAVVDELLCRIGEGDPARSAEMYAEQGDWKLDWPETEHGRTSPPWVRHRSIRADAVAQAFDTE